MAGINARYLDYSIEFDCVLKRSFVEMNKALAGNRLLIEGTDNWTMRPNPDILINPLHDAIALTIKSPKLTGVLGLAETMNMVEYIEHNGTLTNECNLKVHVDGQHVPFIRIESMIKSFTDYESLFFLVNGLMFNQKYARSNSLRRDKIVGLPCTVYPYGYTSPVGASPDMFSPPFDLSNYGNTENNVITFDCFVMSTEIRHVFLAIFMAVGFVSHFTYNRSPMTLPETITPETLTESYASQTFNIKRYHICGFEYDSTDPVHRILLDHMHMLHDQDIVSLDQTEAILA